VMSVKAATVVAETPTPLETLTAQHNNATNSDQVSYPTQVGEKDHTNSLFRLNEL
jgi:hypothetical protein